MQWTDELKRAHESWSRVAVWLCALFGTFACTETKFVADHCARYEGDATCLARHGDDLSYCSGMCIRSSPRGDGCVASQPENDCYIPCGGLVTLAEDPSLACNEIADGETASTEETSSIDPPAPDCENDEDCTDTARTFCREGACVPCSGAPEGGNEACATRDAGTPICVDDVCVQCTIEEPRPCEGNLRVCDGQSHTCVQCTTEAREACDADLLACDEATHTCVACTAHAQCGTGDEAACDLERGTCFPSDPGVVRHVGIGQEFETIGTALASVGPNEQAVLVLHGTTPFDESAVLTEERIVAFKWASDSVSGSAWVQTQAMGQPTLTVRSGAIAYLDDIPLLNNTQIEAAALDVDDAIATLQGCRIGDLAGIGIAARAQAKVTVEQSDFFRNAAGSILVENSILILRDDTSIVNSGSACILATAADVTVLDSRILQCPEAGISIVGSTLWLERSRVGSSQSYGVSIVSSPDVVLRNSFIFTSDVYAHEAVHIEGSTVDLLYTTVGVQPYMAMGRAPLNIGKALTCDAGSTVTIRNSLFATAPDDPPDDPPEFDCPVAVVSNSASENLIEGMDNVALGSLVADLDPDPTNGWFVRSGTGDLHLTRPPEALLTAARWRTGDPEVDIDGHPRPMIEGTLDVAGADVPVVAPETQAP